MLYKIKKNRHYCQWTMPQLHFHATGFKIRFTFDKSCLYDKSELGSDWADLNKLFGIGMGLFHHRNSFRIAWRPDGDKILLFAYWYDDSKLYYEQISSINVNEEYAITVDLCTKKAHITLFNKNAVTYIYHTVLYNKSGIKKNFFCFTLRPYFGGNKKAPHDMQIDIPKIVITN